MSDAEALRALEQRVVELAERRIVPIAATVTAALTNALQVRAGRRVPFDVTEIFSRPDVDKALNLALSTAATGVSTVVTAGYWAGVRTGVTRSLADLEALGVTDESSAAPGPDGATVTAIVTRATDAITGSRLEISNTVRASIDPIVNDAREALTTFVVLGVATAAIDKVVRRLAVVARVSAAIAVHRGYTDAQLAYFRQAVIDNTHLRLVKRWVTGPGDQCPACRALDGATAELSEAFDATATADPGFVTPRVYPDLLGPPRHPHCRCRLVIEPTTATNRLQRALDAVPPGGYTYLDASAVRAMSAPAYRAMLGFLSAALDRVRHLSSQVHSG